MKKINITIFKNICGAFLFLFALISCNNNKPENINLNSLSADSLTVLINKWPNNAMLYYKRGLQYAQSNNYNSALTDFNKSIQLDSLTVDYYIAPADIFLNIGKSEITRQLLLKANRLIPNNAQVLYRLGSLYFYVNDYKKAHQYLNSAIEADKFFAPAYFSRALVYRETGDTALAITNLQVAVERDPQYYSAYLVLASIYANQNNPVAIDYYNNALNIEPLSYEALYGKAFFYQQNNQVNLANNWYDTILIKLGNDKPYVHYNKGYIDMIYNENYTAAINCFNKAIELKPDYAEAFCNLAFSYEQQLNFTDAKKMYRKALEINPQLQPAIIGLKRVEQKK